MSREAGLRTADEGDVQAIIDRGFGTLSGSAYLLLKVTDALEARRWLLSLPVTSLAQAKTERLPRVCQLAFTASGLEALGLPLDRISGFAPEFLDGMASDERRSFRLGDEGMNAPERWEWGVGTREPHVLVVLLAYGSEIDAFESEVTGSIPSGALELLLINRGNRQVAREPFGFTDGVSQPAIDWDAALEPGGAKDRIYRNRIALGEFVLGYPNEYGFVTNYPQDGELGLNGSYLVYRQLAQDVSGLWKWLADVAGKDGALALAELMVGRGIDGDPLPSLPHEEVRGETSKRNHFTFASDPDGVALPIGAHIRRANPRSGDDPQGRRGFFRDIISSLGLKGSAMHDAVASARFHRILRRGRAYGPVVSPEEAMNGSPSAEEAGLHFICINANLARQFEFVQGSWVASPYFAGLSGEQDPLLGNRCPVAGGRVTDAFSYWDADGNPCLMNRLPNFVTVKGGAYFFLPGISALKRILTG